MICTRAKRLTLVVSLAVAESALAMPPEYQVNAREACRRAIAGAYLNAYGELDRLGMEQRAATAQVVSLGAKLAEAQRRYDTAVAKHKAAGFDQVLAAERDEARSLLELLTAQRRDYAAQASRASQGQTRQLLIEQQLRKQVEKVFIIARTGDLPDGGYPEHVDYRSPCPKFRSLCPLPDSEQELLLGIQVDGQTPEACQRYVTMTKGRR